MRESEISELIGFLLGAYPAVRIQDRVATLRAYSVGLRDLEYDVAHGAIADCVARCRWFPTIAEIRSAAARLKVSSAPPELAFEEVERAIRRFGVYRTPQFSDPFIEAAVNSLGWKNICNWDLKNMGTLRAQFERSYAAARDREEKRVNVGGLLGEQEPSRRLEASK